MTLVYRLEDDQYAGPFIGAAHVPNFTPEYAKQKREDNKEMGRALGWLKVDSDGIKMHPDATHPHHSWDVEDAEAVDEMGMLELLLGAQPTWRTGVKDERQLLHWFPPQSFDFFKKHGYRVDVYDVPDMAIKWGKYQLLFNSAKATLVKTEPFEVLAQEAAK